jgi:hypothetical protein
MQCDLPRLIGDKKASANHNVKYNIFCFLSVVFFIICKMKRKRMNEKTPNHRRAYEQYVEEPFCGKHKFHNITFAY